VPAITATYFNDPGCPWGYSFRPTHARLLWRFGDQIEWRLVLIGLTESGEEYERRGFTAARMAALLPEFRRRFGMPFTFAVKERMAGTSRACRAVVAVREQDPSLADAALRALQLLQFTTPRLLDDDEAIADALARVPGIDAQAIVARIDDPEVVAAYEADRALARSAEGTPTHAQHRTAGSPGGIRYTAPSVIFERADGQRFEVGGFQPFEAYDTALANLDPALERRPAPADAAEALRAFPHGLTTAEVATLLRPHDTDADDRAAAEAQLTALVGEGTVVCEPAGGDALWRLARPDEQAAGRPRLVEREAA
jgi:2-hydroxychromene-2-carboxylate isomerase